MLYTAVKNYCATVLIVFFLEKWVNLDKIKGFRVIYVYKKNIKFLLLCIRKGYIVDKCKPNRVKDRVIQLYSISMKKPHQHLNYKNWRLKDEINTSMGNFSATSIDLLRY